MMMQTRLLKRQDGFTMIEIIAVLILIGILAAVAIPKFMSLQKDAELKSVQGVKSELASRANQYFAQYLLNPTNATYQANNLKTLAQWAGTETVGADFTLSTYAGQIQVTLASSGNRYLIAFTRGVNATDGTGSAALFGTVTAR